MADHTVRQTRTKAKMSEETRRALLQAARHAFGTKGYANVAMEDLVDEAGVTRGALYHHFSSKQGLFEALIELLDSEISELIKKACSDIEDPWVRFIKSCQFYLELVTHDVGLRRIMFRDSPAVLSYERIRQIDHQSAIIPIRQAIDELSAQGRIRALPRDALAHLINGALADAALWIGDNEDPIQALNEAKLAFEALLSGLQKA